MVYIPLLCLFLMGPALECALYWLGSVPVVVVGAFSALKTLADRHSYEHIRILLWRVVIVVAALSLVVNPPCSNSLKDYISKGSNFVPIYDQVTNVPWNCFEAEWEAEPPLPPGMAFGPTGVLSGAWHGFDGTPSSRNTSSAHCITLVCNRANPLGIAPTVLGTQKPLAFFVDGATEYRACGVGQKVYHAEGLQKPQRRLLAYDYVTNEESWHRQKMYCLFMFGLGVFMIMVSLQSSKYKSK
ncbi:hypothetical protein QOT17_019317 [Balamuthia mandrillaris]